MRLEPFLGLAAVCFALALSSPAGAQGAPGRDAAPVPGPQARPDPGEPDRIRAAYMASRDPAILLDLATSLRRLGRHADAAVVYEEWKRDPRADPTRAVEVMRALADIELFVGRLTIHFDDPTARVWLDGRELPLFTSGSVVRVDPGDHQVSAARGAFPPVTQAVRIGTRETRAVQLRLGTYVSPGAVMVPPPPIVQVVSPGGSQPGFPAPPVDGARVASTVLLVGGGLGIAAGAAAGIAAIALEFQSRSHCLGGGKACDKDGVDLQGQSRTAGSACTIALGSGAALMLTGIILRAATGGRSGSGALPGHLHAGASGMEVVW